jgi:hypothetical protein
MGSQVLIVGGIAQAEKEMRDSLRRMTAALAVGGSALACSAAEPQLAVNPWFPAYGQAVQVELRGANTYLPAMRYTRSGNTIIAEYEDAGASTLTTRADFGSLPLALGELAPGSYRILGRLFDMSQPSAAPRAFEQQIQVAPPDAAGVFVVPRYPDAYQPLEIVVQGEYLLDPATLKATVANGTIHVDYTYAGDMPAGTPMDGYVAFASVKVAGLAPGYYKVEAVGSDRRWSTYQRVATGNVTIDRATEIVEYYAADLDHYFVSAWPDEVALIDDGGRPGFKRTGQRFRAWLRASEAPANAVPVCRFYASGPNSHFYTGDSNECQSLKSLEQKQRAEAQAKGERFAGWQFEAVAFYALAAQAGACPANTQPVYRDYNMRGGMNDSNHRFIVNAQLRDAMRAGSGWVEEGVAFCSPL